MAILFQFDSVGATGQPWIYLQSLLEISLADQVCWASGLLPSRDGASIRIRIRIRE